MLHVEEAIIIGLINRAVTGRDFPLDADFDKQKLLEICRDGSLIPLVFRGMKDLPGIPQDLYNTFLLSSFHAAAYSKAQDELYQRIRAAFEADSIDYLPLKGIELKDRYPSREIRTMGDLDILIRTEQYDRIREIMTMLGCTEIRESDHELKWECGSIHIELHKRLIPSDNDDFTPFFRDGWQLAERKDGCRWGMSRENTFVYLFTHFVRHYRDGGVGIRQLTDLWVYLRTEPDMDTSYLRQSMETLRLSEFYDNVLRTLSVLFDGAEPDPVTDRIARHLFDSGTYGTQEEKDAAYALRVKNTDGDSAAAKCRQWVEKIFPPYPILMRRYPVLKGRKWLFPLFWVIRWLDVLFRSPGRIHAAAEKIEGISDGTADQYRDALEAVGLHYYHGEHRDT